MIDDDLKRYLDAKFADIDVKFAEIDVKFAEIHAKFAEMASKQDLERVETSLLTEFR